MNIDQLTDHVLRGVRPRAAELGLAGERLQVEYVLNWGGFVAASFTVSDGDRRLHLKLSSSVDGRTALRRWEALHRNLEQRYHAPDLIAWIEVTGTAYGGLMFEHISGQTLDLRRRPEFFNRVASVIESLHGDRELARIIESDGIDRTHLDGFRSRYIEMFEEDLSFIADSLPPFVSRETFDWMESETRRLEQLAIESRAFEGRAMTPIHGDLWPNNILVTAEGDWFLVDWDDLSLGDPALDYATLAWPLTHGEDSIDWRRLPIPISDVDFAGRMSVYQRALMLDWVIDVLADWKDCESAPQYRDLVRDQKRNHHLFYLEMYRARYG